MSRDQLLSGLIARAESDERVLALLLGGSLGRGGGDAWSDLDLIAVVAPEHHAAFAEGARAWMEQAAPLVLWAQPYPGAPLFNAITQTWLRADLTVTVPGRVTSARHLCRPVLDRAAVWKSLPAVLSPRAPDPARVDALVQEFIRVLGLLPVALGRGEHVVSVTGAGLQRAALISLMIQALELPQPPGTLHLSRLLSADDMRLLEALPAAEANRASLIAAHHALAAAFLPRARALMERTRAPWPEAFWAATRTHLQKTLGAEWPGLA